MTMQGGSRQTPMNSTTFGCLIADMMLTCMAQCSEPHHSKSHQPMGAGWVNDSMSMPLIVLIKSGHLLMHAQKGMLMKACEDIGQLMQSPCQSCKDTNVPTSRSRVLIVVSMLLSRISSSVPSSSSESPSLMADIWPVDCIGAATGTVAEEGMCPNTLMATSVSCHRPRCTRPMDPSPITFLKVCSP